MATAPDSLFLPPLEKCFNREIHLLSWKAVHEALCNNNITSTDSSLLRRFLGDEHVQAQLAQPFNAFPVSSPETARDFETRTAAIHVTPSHDGSYNISEIKEDTKWLSQHAGIDEISALRLVVLEWQERPALQLLKEYSEGEALSIKQAIGDSNLLVSVLGAKPPTLSVSMSSAAQFSSTPARRERLLRYHITEKEKLLSSSVILLAMYDGRADSSPEESTKDNRLNAQDLNWTLKSVSKRIFSAHRDHKPQSSAKRSALKSNSFLDRCVSNLQGRFMNVGGGSPPSWSETIEESIEFEEFFMFCQFAEITHTLNIILIHLDNAESITSSSTVRAWFDICNDYGLYKDVSEPSSLPQPFDTLIQTPVALISLMILVPLLTFEYLSDDTDHLSVSTVSDPANGPYIANPSCQMHVSAILFRAADNVAHVASLAVFAWSIILQSMRAIVTEEDNQQGLNSPEISYGDYRAGEIDIASTSSPKKKCFREVLDDVMSLSYDDDPITHLARCAVNDLQVYSVVSELSSIVFQIFGHSALENIDKISRRNLLQLVRGTLPHTIYGPEIVAATLAVVSGNSENHFPESHSSLLDTVFDGDEIQKLFAEARFRYPYEINPFLRLCKALTTVRSTGKEHDIIPKTILEMTSKFTHTLPDHFTDYELVREDENANGLRLTKTMELFQIRKANVWPSSQHSSAVIGPNLDNSSVIPDGTVGYVLNDSKPFVVTWIHDHMAAKYLTRLLSTGLIATEYIDKSGPVDRETIADIVDLFTKTLSVWIKYAELHHRTNYEDVQGWLVEISDGMFQNQDIISIVASMFEEDVQRQLTLARGEASTQVLSSCVAFFTEIVRIHPGRIWPVLSRTELLDIDGRGAKLTDVVAAIEIPSGRYPFLRACLDLFSALVDDVIGNAVARNSPSVNTAKRFEKGAGVGAGIPQKLISKILLFFTRTFANVLQNSSEWHFILEESRSELYSAVMSLFRKLISTVYGFDDTKETRRKITAVLAPSASYIIECFGSISDLQAPNRILQLVIIPNLSSTNIIFSRSTKLGLQQTSVALKFLATIVKVGTLLETHFDKLASQIISSVPMLAHIYASSLNYRTDIVTLLSGVVEAQGRSTKNPPSIFGSITPESSKEFLSLLAEFDKPFLNLDLEVAIWDFFSVVVSNRQRWLATFLLTGRTPRDIGNSDGQDAKKTWAPPSLLNLAIKNLSDITSLQPERAIAILRFVAVAQNHWPWVTDKLRRNVDALSSMTDFIDQLRDDYNTKDPMHALAVAKRNRIASLINEILASYLYTCRQTGDESFLKALIPKLGYLRARAVDIPNYNVSLHKNLESNVKRCLPGLELSAFKQTLLKNEFGPDYCYDRTFAATILESQQSWAPSRGQGFKTEFFLANCNLSLVESQIELLQSWSVLAIELGSSTPLDLDLQKHLCGIAQNCLKANIASENSEQVFEDLRQTRIDLALVLLQRLTSTRSQVPRMLELLSTAWTAVRTCGQDFEIAFIGKNTPYYRSLLKILFLSIQPHTYMQPAKGKSTNTSNSAMPTAQLVLDSAPTLVEIVTQVIAKGFRSLATQLHESAPETVLPSDFALLTALLQSILSIPSIQNVQSQIALQLYSSSVGRNAAALFSWSDQLTAADHDPVFGELSILFLLALSSIPLMAEHLAVEGILSQLASANITNYYRRSHGAGPFDDPRRLHAIWTRGILPLCLNMLTSIGVPMATEVAGFLVGFERQLTRASSALDPKASPSPAKPTAGGISLGLAAEIQSLALLTTMLDGYRGQPGAGDIPVLLGWDRAGIKEDLEGWVQGSRDILRARVVPTNEPEVEMSRLPPVDGETSGCDNRLEERVLLELRGALRCLGGDGGGSSGGT